MPTKNPWFCVHKKMVWFMVHIHWQHSTWNLYVFYWRQLLFGLNILSLLDLQPCHTHLIDVSLFNHDITKQHLQISLMWHIARLHHQRCFVFLIRHTCSSRRSEAILSQRYSDWRYNPAFLSGFCCHRYPLRNHAP